MKLLIFHIIFFFSAFYYPQTFSGFENIPWESSKNYVITAMSEAYNLKPGYEKEDAIGFSGGSFLSRKVYIWSFQFYNNKLHTVIIVFRNTSDLNQLRNDIISGLSEKYGSFTSEEKDFNGNLANVLYFQDDNSNTTDLINLIKYETSSGEETYQLTFVNIALFEHSESNGEYYAE